VLEHMYIFVFAS